MTRDVIEETDCGHTVVDVDGQAVHHDIPDDGADHVPAATCGCGPVLHTPAGHVVYVHPDQEGDTDDVGW